MIEHCHYDIVVIGSGPAGQKSAIQAAKLGKSVALIERNKSFGGACVHRGTIPSKTLRENALRVKSMRQNAALGQFTLDEAIEMSTLIDRLGEVLSAHDQFMRHQVDRNQIVRIHGRASFLNATTIQVELINKKVQHLSAKKIIIATGSQPRHPAHIHVDHEHILDSDSILSIVYLPTSLTVLGGGVIASEYASIFQALGVKVTMIDRYPSPLGFLDKDMTDCFIREFEAMGGTWLGNQKVTSCQWNGVDAVVTYCEDGTHVVSEKVLCAAGRIANVKELAINNAGLTLNSKGLLTVDDNLCTDVATIYAAGDVIGPPSLASASMEQGRRAARHALGVATNKESDLIPTGIYGIPELSSVGLTEQQAKEKYGEILIGKARFSEVARGQISGNTGGMLKIVSDQKGKKILGVMIIGEASTEVIHIGQMAMICQATVDTLIESTFNFPTLAEAYRIAALDILAKRKE